MVWASEASCFPSVKRVVSWACSSRLDFCSAARPDSNSAIWASRSFRSSVNRKTSKTSMPKSRSLTRFLLSRQAGLKLRDLGIEVFEVLRLTLDLIISLPRDFACVLGQSKGKQHQ